MNAQYGLYKISFSHVSCNKQLQVIFRALIYFSLSYQFNDLMIYTDYGSLSLASKVIIHQS